MDDVSVISGLLDGKAKVTMWLGSFVGLDGVYALCDISNGDESGRVPARVTTSYRPEVNEQVFVVAVDGKYFLLGPSTPKPAQGTVTAVGSDTVTVSTDMGDVAATVGVGMTLSAGQVVKLFWSDGAHVISALTAAPAPVPPPPPPGPSTSQHVDVFTAVDAGSFSGGRWWQAQPWASDTTLGAWFMGSKIRDTLRGAPVSKIELWSSLASQFGSNPNIGTHPHLSKPGGGPTISNATPIAVGPGRWITLPTSFGQALSDGTAAGIGLAHGGYNRFNSLAADAQSGALRISSTY
ncbi:hypothetical protein [Curtobacterium sp. MCSS17_015]|uniref:hypothetical protein n=1 Tax=Curtobacterium sp. MCSS17_015 TaxID=2175666 RepID=UPI000DA87FAD|nr:hypothetical protein [Curtobacterium sp. MCSS17_015]WIB25807.1 hypothetical protein DEJ18_12215 [Curtobacterium sp. MCSS17_015]